MYRESIWFTEKKYQRLKFLEVGNLKGNFADENGETDENDLQLEVVNPGLKRYHKGTFIKFCRFITYI